MNQVLLHKVDNIIAHLDMNDELLAIEIPPSILEDSRIELKDISHLDNNTFCSRGLDDCTDELTLASVKYTLVCDYRNIVNLSLTNVAINNKSIHDALLKAIQERDADTADVGWCSAFAPISSKHGGTYDCKLCSLYGNCLESGVTKTTNERYYGYSLE